MFQYQFMQNAMLASVFIAILCPSVGVFLVLKRQSMIGDTLSHASLAGVAIGLVLGYNPIICAFIFTSICGLAMEYLRGYYRKFADLILAIILALCVGIAIILISSGRIGTNVNTFLFGSILTVTRGDLLIMFILSIISILTLSYFYNDLIYITFDEEGARIAGVKTRLVNYIFALLVGATISVSMRIMGMMVISSMIALPVATALQLEAGFRRTLIYSVLFGFIDILSGLLLSVILDCAPGGTISVMSVIILLVVLLINKYIKK